MTLVNYVNIASVYVCVCTAYEVKYYLSACHQNNQLKKRQLIRRGQPEKRNEQASQVTRTLHCSAMHRADAYGPSQYTRD
jgi:hypothetical protein